MKILPVIICNNVSGRPELPAASYNSHCCSNYYNWCGSILIPPLKQYPTLQLWDFQGCGYNSWANCFALMWQWQETENIRAEMELISICSSPSVSLNLTLSRDSCVCVCARGCMEVYMFVFYSTRWWPSALVRCSPLQAMASPCTRTPAGNVH